MRRIPNITIEQAEQYHADGFFTDATLKMFKVCCRYQHLRNEGKKRGEAVLVLMDEFNLGQARIEQMIDPPPRSTESAVPIGEDGFTYK